MSDVEAIPPSRKKIFTVHELTGEIRSLLEDHFSSLWVEGEISDLRSPRSGHLYFTLKDSKASIKIVIFKSHLRFLRFVPKEGTHVLIRAHLSLYEPRGEYQLICDYIEPLGAGALQAAFEALKEKLQQEGLFDLERKRPIPFLPVRIGIITSPNGAAIQDVMKVLQNSDFHCHIFLYPVSVQGSSAANEIAQALDQINRFSQEAPHPLDLLLLTRGGGSLEDLWAFNDPAIAYAIAHSKIPVISAVGHESDTSIADHVADLRAPTPTAAAEIIVRRGLAAVESFYRLHEKLLTSMQRQMESHRNQLYMAMRLLTAPTHQTHFLKNRIQDLHLRLNQSMDHLLTEQRRRIQSASQGLVHLSPVHQLTHFRQQLNQLKTRLTQEGRKIVAKNRTLLQTGMNQLNLVSPLNILERGYSITRRLPLKEVVRKTSDVCVGDQVEIKLHKGSLICTTEEIKRGK